MPSNAQSPDPNTQVIRESFGRVVYSHKTHEKAREFASAKSDKIKWANVVLTTLTSGSFISTIFTDQKALLVVSAVLAALTVAFMVYQLSFNPEQEAERHRVTAKELWSVREKYIFLLSDMRNDPTRIDIERRRDGLTNELSLIYKFAPNTSSAAYRAAQHALKISEDMTFSNEEINSFLPDALHFD